MLPIQRKISSYNFSSRYGNKIQYIVLHYTGNSSDSALGNANYFNTCNRGASAHYFVDDNNIYQVVEDNHSSWAVGDGKGRYGITNANSINIEMCTSGNYIVSNKTEENTMELVKYLMDKYDIDINHVVRHYDASRKLCPNWSNNNWERWTNFKSKLVSNGKWIRGMSEGNTEKWWYRHDDGSYTMNNWEKINGEWYFFDKDGWMQTGWIQSPYSNEWFYCYSDGIMAHDCDLYGWRFDSNGVGTKL